MEISYNKLWKLLIDREMTKTDLRRLSGISSSTLAIMGKGCPVTTAVLDKICLALACHPNDILSAKALARIKYRKSKPQIKDKIIGEEKRRHYEQEPSPCVECNSAHNTEKSCS